MPFLIVDRCSTRQWKKEETEGQATHRQVLPNVTLDQQGVQNENLLRLLRSRRAAKGNIAPGETPIWNRRGCSSEILNLTPKGDHLGVAHAFCDP